MKSLGTAIAGSSIAPNVRLFQPKITPADLARDLSLLRDLEALLAQTRYEAAIGAVRRRIAILEGEK